MSSSTNNTDIKHADEAQLEEQPKSFNSADFFFKKDEILSKDVKTRDLRELEGFGKPASKEAVETAIKNMTAKGYKVTHTASKQEALKTLIDLIPDDSTIYNGGSTSLEEIGYLDFLKDGHKGKKWTNVKAAVVEAMGKQDWAKMQQEQTKAWVANYWVTSAAGVSQQGDIVWGSATGTRVSAHAAGKLVFVIGTNKIVPTYEDAVRRLYEYQLPIESARSRAVYKAPGSAVNEEGSIKGSNPYAPGRIHVIVVDGALGY